MTARALIYRVRDADGRLIAACVEPEAAAAVVGAVGGPDWTVRIGNRIIWREGDEPWEAGDSYDQTAAILDARRFHGTWTHLPGTRAEINEGSPA